MKHSYRLISTKEQILPLLYSKDYANYKTKAILLLHPQSDGIVDRLNITILRNHLLYKETKGFWNLKIPIFLLAYRSAAHETTIYNLKLPFVRKILHYFYLLVCLSLLLHRPSRRYRITNHGLKTFAALLGRRST